MAVHECAACGRQTARFDEYGLCPICSEREQREFEESLEPSFGKTLLFALIGLVVFALLAQVMC